MLKLLRQLIQIANNEEDIEQILTIIVQHVREALHSDVCSIFLIDHARPMLTLRAADGIPVNPNEPTNIPLDKGLIGLVVKRGEAVNISTVMPDADNFNNESCRAFLGVPIQYRRRLSGVLMVYNKSNRTYDELEESFLVTLAIQLAGIISKSEAHGALTQAEQQSQKTNFTLRGFGGSPGIGIGQAKVICVSTKLSDVPDRKIENIEAEIDSFCVALQLAREETKQMEERLSVNLSSEERELFHAYLKILDSQAFKDEVVKRIRQNQWAQGAVAKVVRGYVRQFEEMENEYFKERSSDLRDLGHRILFYLESKIPRVIKYPKRTILVGEEIAVSHLADVPEDRLAGIVSTTGSSNSHIAILARALGIPIVMGARALPIAKLHDKQIIVDGYSGNVHLSPSLKVLRAFERLAREETALDAELKYLQQLPAKTTDGQIVALYTNTGLMSGIERSLSINSEGIGLYRTEMPFMICDRFPSVQEQQIIYRRLLEAFAPRPVTMRLLDIGGDKTLPYFPIKESNPFLGWRGIRVLLDHPEIFSVQVRAMLQANIGLNNLKIMLPMITDVSEVDDALAMIDKIYQEILAEGVEMKKPEVGVMVEVPAAVYQGKALAERVDFLSVGSNDLTQYLLAVDRNNAQVANLYSSFHPTVLQALMQIVERAHGAKKKVSICGEMAGNPTAVVLLMAMGFDALSMSANNLLRVKWVIRTFSMRKAKKLLKEALLMENATHIRKLLERALIEAGLGGLVRPGKR